jgi:hypothetical protein
VAPQNGHRIRFTYLSLKTDFRNKNAAKSSPCGRATFRKAVLAIAS